jgi:oxygen-independent coproporphyrinogen-3 oxidase
MSSFSLYVHIPYCVAKCPYCDFNSYAAERWPEERYVAALAAELRGYASQAPWEGAVVRTLFFGGGTPSLFAAASIARILDAARRHWRVAADAEITLEANPGTVTAEKLVQLRAAGINRLSFGVQSFQPHHLRTLGRRHSAEEAEAAVRQARRAGFDNVSIDLIFALPEQTPSEWEQDLQRACALATDHLSAYNLTYEEGTPFHQWRKEGKLRSLPEEVEVAMFSGAQECLARAGYEQYEISNYARPGRACRHNLNYWQSGNYLGVGAGAHSYTACGDRAGAWGGRWSNERSPSRYMQAVEERAHARCAAETLDERQARGEYVFLALRCRAGVSDEAFRERFGAALLAAFPHVTELRTDGLLAYDGTCWRLTPRGLWVADSVFTTFL